MHRTEIAVDSDTGFWMEDNHMSFGISSDRKLLAFVLGFGSGEGGYLVDLKSGDVLQRFENPGDTFSRDPEMVLFAPDNRALLVGGGHRGLWALDPSGKKELLEASTIAFSLDGRRVALGEKRRVRVGEVDSIVPLQWRSSDVVYESERDIDRLQFSPDGGRVAIADGSDRVVVVDVATRAILLDAEDPHVPGQRMRRIEALGFSADGRRLFVHAEVAPVPLAPEKEQCIVVCSIPERRSLGTLFALKRDDKRLQVVGSTSGGFVSLLPPELKAESGAPLGRGSIVAAALRGDSIEPLLDSGEIDAALDLEERIRFWSRLVGEKRLAGGEAGWKLVDNSRGLTHLLPYVVEQVDGPSDGGPARFGERGGEGMSLPPTSLHRELHALRQRSPSEREVLFEEMLERIVAEENRRRAQAQAARRAEERRLKVARLRPWLMALAAVALIAGLVLYMIFGKR